MPETRLALVDGRDALATVVIRPHPDDPDAITVEANARGLSKAVAAYALRQTADEFDAAALAEGDTPITAEEAAAEQQHRAAVEEPAAQLTATAALYEAMRRIADAPQDYELDPGRGDARATLRALLAEIEGKAQPPAHEEPHTPRVGDQYVKRADPDAGRVITVERVWTADDGHTAVAYKWHDPRASYAGSACPLDVFHRTYEAEAHR